MVDDKEDAERLQNAGEAGAKAWVVDVSSIMAASAVRNTPMMAIFLYLLWCVVQKGREVDVASSFNFLWDDV